MSDPPKPLWTAAEIAALPEVHIRHPLNPASDVHLRPVGQLAGLQRLVLTVARIPPGKESFIYHAHERDEEDLVYLMGGERSGLDVGTFPGVGKRILYTGREILLIDEAALRKLELAEFFPDGPPGATGP